MEQTVTVSIIVPVYNAKAYLEKCVESLLEQTFSAFELLLVDDGSADGSGEICDSYAKRDSRIRVIHQENAGVSAARNCALSQAEGEYIAFVDADDRVSPRMIELLYRELTENHADMAMCRIVVEKDGKQELRDDKFPCGIYEDGQVLQIARAMFGGQSLMSSVWRCLFKAEIIREAGINFPSMHFAEDLFFDLEYLLCCKRVCFSSHPLYYYNKNNPASALAIIRRDYMEDFLSIPVRLYRLFEKYNKLTPELMEGIGQEYFLCVQRAFSLAQQEYGNGRKGYRFFASMLNKPELRCCLRWNVIQFFTVECCAAATLLKFRCFWVFWRRWNKKGDSK